MSSARKRPHCGTTGQMNDPIVRLKLYKMDDGEIIAGYGSELVAGEESKLVIDRTRRILPALDSHEEDDDVADWVEKRGEGNDALDGVGSLNNEDNGGAPGKGTSMSPDNTAVHGSCPGLRNLGCTCFMNSVLQALAACVPFLKWIGKLDRYSHVATHLKHILHELNFATRKAVDSCGLRTALWGSPAIDQPQDCHEMFQQLMEALEGESDHPDTDHQAAPEERGDATHETQRITTKERDDATPDTQRITTKERGDATPDTQSIKTKERDDTTPDTQRITTKERGDATHDTQRITTKERGDATHDTQRITTKERGEPDPDTGPTLVEKRHNAAASIQRDCNSRVSGSMLSPFQGNQLVELQCKTCHHKYPTRNMPFYSVTINVTDDMRRLEDMMAHLTQPQIIENVHCTKCNMSDGTSSVYSQRVSFAKLPECLCIHINKAASHNHVTFPQTLHVPQISEESQEVLRAYHVVAVVCHTGDVTSGQYMTYRRGPAAYSESWFYTQDDHTRAVTWREVDEAEPYMLMYTLSV